MVLYGTIEAITVENKTVEALTVENKTVEALTVENKTVEALADDGGGRSGEGKSENRSRFFPV